MKATLQFRITQGLKMTPQLQQAIYLLQLSNIELNAMIQEQLDSNLMLETEDDKDEDENSNSINSGEEKDTAEFDSEREFNENDSNIISKNKNNPENQYSELAFEKEDDRYKSLEEELRWQLNLMPITDNDKVISEIIIDSLNDDGFLEISLNEILNTANTTIEDIALDEVEAVLKIIQSLEPAGVGARGAQESLLIQLNQLDQKIPEVKKSKEIIMNYFELLVAHDYKKLTKKLKIDESELKEILSFIKYKLNARPGSQISSSRTEYTVPDVNVKKINDKWIVKLNKDAIPELRINSIYKKMIRKGNNSADNQTMKTHLQDAEWTIKSLQHRNDTLLSVAKCIVEHQSDFLEHGEEAMKPLILQNVADSLGMHESTISRATTKKYMQTPRGTYELKYFFPSHVSTDYGHKKSSTAIQALIKKFIDTEEPTKPLSDEKISILLKEEGVNVARRTIAKYREAMAIPTSNERKRLSI